MQDGAIKTVVKHEARAKSLMVQRNSTNGSAGASPSTLKLFLMLFCLAGCTNPKTPVAYTDSLRNLHQWHIELEAGGDVRAVDGAMVIDVPAGCSVWFKQLLHAPVVIEYDATMISAGGPNDRVSDLNCFWMARDARGPDDIFATKRSGAFSDYNQLRCYYVGMGGNANTTTRFRRYVGDSGLRPLLPEHDLSDPKFLLEPNRKYKIRLEAIAGRVKFIRDGEVIFDYLDEAPYTSGWFAIRTVKSHLRIENFRVMQKQS